MASLPPAPHEHELSEKDKSGGFFVSMLNVDKHVEYY